MTWVFGLEIHTAHSSLEILYVAPNLGVFFILDL